MRYLVLAALLLGCASKPPVPVTPPVVEAPKPRPPKPPKAEKQPIQNIFFDVDVDTLTSGQVGALTRLRNWHARHPVDLICSGYADTTGTEGYNDSLSLRRAKAVAAHVPCRVEAHGETVQFGADNANRRVTIKPDTTKKK